MRLSHRQALLLYALTVVAAVITMIGTGPAAHADGPGQGAPWVVPVGDSYISGGQLAVRSCLRQAWSSGSPRSATCTPSGIGLLDGEPRMSLG